MTVTRLRLLALVFVVGLGFAPGSSVAASNRRIAVVIENSEYQNAGSLPAVRESARAVSEALRGAGIEVLVERNLDRSGMQSLMSRFQEPLGRSDFAIVYYAGLTLSIKGQSFLLPVDAKLGSEMEVIFETIGLNEFLKSVSNPTYMSLVAIDPIAQNPLAASLAGSMGSQGEVVRPVPAKPESFSNMIFALALQPGASSATATGASSPFSAALVEELLRPGAEVGDAMAAVERTVRSGAGGRPFIQGKLQEKLVLVPAPRPEPAPAATAAAVPPPVTPPVVAEVIDPINNTPYVTTKDINLRQSPGGAVTGSISRGTNLTAIGRARSSTSWVQVEHNGKLGFVHTGNLADPASLTAGGSDKAGSGKAASGQTQSATISPGDYVVTNLINVFEKPVLGARSNRELDEGAPVTVVAITPDGAWVQIRDAFSLEGYLPKRSALNDLASANAGQVIQAAVSKNDKVLPASPPDPGEADEAEGLFTLGPGMQFPLTAEVRQSAKLALDAVTRVSAAGGILSEAEAASRKAQEAQANARRAAEAARFQGSGSFKAVNLPDGGVYEGEWVNGAKHGAGRHWYANGDTYEGTWQNNLMQGYGVYQYTSGDRFEGQMKGNEASGYGIIHFANGDVYKGRVSRARFNEYGSIAFKSGDRYQGQFGPNGLTGHGVMTFPDGSRFIGHFQQGKQNGAGVFVTSDGGSYRQGLWDGPQSASR